jgi:ribonucleoside-diphosphate reductase alpha chain
MRKVAWDRGPVRHGHRVRDDGTRVPLWHDSEVSAIAYALQAILARRAGRPQPEAADSADTAPAPTPIPGRKCPDCGAHAMIRRAGCDHCTACGFVGACG